MKKIGFKQLLYLLLITFIASCQKVPEHTKVIPEDATAVMRINVAQLADKSGLAENDGLKNKLSQLIEKDLSGETLKTAKAIMENPNESGIDFIEPMFIFSSPEELKADIAILMKVADRGKLTSLMDAMVAEGAFEQFSEDGEIAYSMIGSLFAAYNNELLILMQTKYDVSETEYLSLIKKRMSSSVDESIAGIEAFRKICKSDADIQFFVNKNFIAEANNYLLSNMMTGFPKNFDINSKIADIYNIGELNFDKGAVTLKSECIAGTPEAQKFIDESLGVAGRMNGKFFKMIPQDVLFCAMFNISGEKVLDNPLAKEEIEKLNAEEKQIVTNILKLMDGDMMISVSGNANDIMKNIPDISFYAEISDRKIVEDIIASSGLSVEKDADDVYATTVTRGATLYMKIDKKRFAMSTIRDNVINDKTDRSADLSDFNGDKAAVYVNMKSVAAMAKSISEIAGGFLGLKERAAIDAAEMFEDIKIRTTNDNISKIEINMVNKDDNALKQLVDKAMTVMDISL